MDAGEALIDHWGSIYRIHPSFTDLPRDTLVELARCAVPRTYPPGRIIIQAEDPATETLTLESGRVVVHKDVPWGRSFTFVAATQGLTHNAIACFGPRPMDSICCCLPEGASSTLGVGYGQRRGPDSPKVRLARPSLVQA